MFPRRKYAIYSGSTHRPESGIRSTFPHPPNETSVSSNNNATPVEKRETSMYYFHKYASERLGGKYPKLGLFSDDGDNGLEAVVPPLPTSPSVRPIKSRSSIRKGRDMEPTPDINEAGETLHLVSELSLSGREKDPSMDRKSSPRGDEPPYIEPSDSETSSSGDDEYSPPIASTSKRSTRSSVVNARQDKASTNFNALPPSDDSNTTAIRRSPPPSLFAASSRNGKRRKLEDPSPPTSSDKPPAHGRDGNSKEVRNDPSTGKPYYVFRDSRGKHSYQCLTCPHIRTPNLGDIKRHFQSLKHQEHSFRCVPDCGRTYTREDALRRHIKTSHGSEKQRVVIIESEKRAVRLETRAQAGR